MCAAQAGGRYTPTPLVPEPCGGWPSKIFREATIVEIFFEIHQVDSGPAALRPVIWWEIVSERNSLLQIR